MINPLLTPDHTPLVRGTVMRRVTSYGADWGIVTAHGTTRKTFFNKHSYLSEAESDLLAAGDEVEFEETPDPVNGTKAINLRAIREVTEKHS